MVTASNILGILQIILFVIIIFLVLLYSIPMIQFSCLRYRSNFFTINVCMAIFFCCLFWLYFNIMTDTNVQKLYCLDTCSILFYFQSMCTLQVPLSFVVTSMDRLCCVIYQNRSFWKSKTWIFICLACQWIVGVILSLPILVRDKKTCTLSAGIRYYNFVVIIIVPITVCIVINTIIIRYVHSNSRRIDPQISLVDRKTHRIARRDIHLLRHMVIMLFVFLLGWFPVYIISILMNSMTIDAYIVRISSLLTEISLLLDVIDLYRYSRLLRQYLQRKFRQSCFCFIS